MTGTSVTKRQDVYRDNLIRKRQELASTRPPLAVLSPENNTRHGDLVDQCNGNNEVHVAMTLRKTDAKILQAIEDALGRIDKGTYGVCRDCGEPIATVRLNAVPWTRVCITCKERRSN